MTGLVLECNWMRNRRWWWIGAAALVLAVALLVALRSNGQRVTVDADSVVRRAVFRSYVTASGEIVATRFADIGSSVMGRLVHLSVAEGDRVKTGQVVARIDPVQAQSEADAASAAVRALQAEEQAALQQVRATRAEVEQARAVAREAAARLQREQLLRRDGLTTAAAFDAAEAGSQSAAASLAASEATLQRTEQGLGAAAKRVLQAKAQAVRARDILQKTEIAAPIDGVVSRLQVREGEMVVIGIQNQPGTTLMTISDMSAVNAEVKVAEADVLRVAIGQSAVVTLEALPGRRFTGRVVEVGASALPVVGVASAAREFRVRIRLDNPDPGLRPGLTCDAEVLTSERKDVLTVPLQAVVIRPAADGSGDRTGIFEVKDGVVAFTPVTTGIIGGLDIEVSGVAAGTRVVAGPFQVLRELRDGAAVRVNSPTRQ